MSRLHCNCVFVVVRQLRFCRSISRLYVAVRARVDRWASQAFARSAPRAFSSWAGGGRKLWTNLFAMATCKRRRSALATRSFSAPRVLFSEPSASIARISQLRLRRCFPKSSRHRFRPTKGNPFTSSSLVGCDKYGGYGRRDGVALGLRGVMSGCVHPDISSL